MHSVNVWDKLTRVVVFLLFLAGLMSVGIWYFPLIQQNERMRKEILKMDTQIAKEDEASKQLHARIESLRRDPKAVERLARETLGYAKQGETVVHFEAPSTNVVR